MRNLIREILTKSYHFLVEKRSGDAGFIWAQDVVHEYENDPNVYIQFSDLEKVGVNPMTHLSFNTPAGIYSYPLHALMRNVYRGYADGDDEDEDEELDIDMTWDDFVDTYVPFASNRKYIHFFKVDPKDMFDVSDYSPAMLQKDVSILWNIIKQYARENKKTLKWSSKKEFITFARLNSKKYSKMSILFSACLATIYFIQEEKSVAWTWNGLLRKMGYKGISDKKGTGTIHENEPTQAVFLTKDIAHHIATVENKKKVFKGDLNAVSEMDQVKAVANNWEVIKGIRNPSNWVISVAVGISVDAVRYLMSHGGISDDVAKEAVERRGQISVNNLKQGGYAFSRKLMRTLLSDNKSLVF